MTHIAFEWCFFCVSAFVHLEFTLAQKTGTANWAQKMLFLGVYRGVYP